MGALEDFATGIRDADAMLGKLTAYFSQVDEPVILVFWGDHYNPIDSNYDVYTTTGYASGSSADPRLHQTTLLMWSNYSQQQVDLGTIAAYDISPVMMELFGLEQPLYFQFLNRQLRVASRSRHPRHHHELGRHHHPAAHGVPAALEQTSTGCCNTT